LTDIHRTLLQEHDAAHISESTPEKITEFAKNSYVLLEPVFGPIKKGRIHTRRQGPYKVLANTGNTYTLENLVTKKPVRIHINRLVPFIFDPDRVNPQLIAARDIDEFAIDLIMSHRGTFQNKRKLEFKTQWVGYDSSYNTWEPWKNLKDTEKLHDYLKSINLTKEIPSAYRNKT
jgi:Chromo (CHRromatin Organisation MOdifier) domain